MTRNKISNSPHEQDNNIEVRCSKAEVPRCTRTTIEDKNALHKKKRGEGKCIKSKKHVQTIGEGYHNYSIVNASVNLSSQNVKMALSVLHMLVCLLINCIASSFWHNLLWSCLLSEPYLEHTSPYLLTLSYTFPLSWVLTH